MHVQDTHYLMIAGSRSASRDMLSYACRAVRRAHELGWVILVGDCPRGVDLAVVQECRRLKAPVIVAGTARLPRNDGCRHGSYVRITRDLYRGAGGNLLSGYTARDCWMVDTAQQCLFVWNGDSPGTKAGYEYAVRRGKPADLITFARSPQP